MATKKFPSEMSSRGTVLGTDKILIYNATTGASDEVSTVAELTTAVLSAGAAVSASTVQASALRVLSANTDITENNWGVNQVNSSIITNNASEIDMGGTLGLGGIAGDSTQTAIFGAVAGRKSTNGVGNANGYLSFYTFFSGLKERVRILAEGYVIIGGTSGSYNLTLANDSAGKPGAGGLWTVVSDERIKKDIEEADLDICYDTIKNIPLKRFAWADGVYSEEQVSDRHNLGWIAQDVQKYFSKAVSVKPFTKADGEVIEDCLDLNSGQLNAALYGAVQACMLKIESLEKEIALLKQ